MPRIFHRILAFGDSITLGGDASTKERAWINRLCQWLEECQGAPVHLINRAVGGSVISPQSSAYAPSRKPSGRERVDEAILDWPDPDLILVGYGFNDARGGAPVEEFLANLRSLLDAIRTRSSAPILLLGPYPTSDRFGYGAEWSHASESVLEGFHQGITDLAAERGYLRTDVLTPMSEGEGLLAADGVHPNDAGHLLIATQVYRSLVAMR